MIFIGIDLGTSAVKLIAMKEKRQNSQNRFRNIPCIFRNPVGPSKIPRIGSRA